jgi:hypothetical protein
MVDLIQPEQPETAPEQGAEQAVPEAQKTPPEQPWNKALGTTRNSPETPMEQGKTTSEQRGRNSGTDPYRGGDLVPPPRAHPLSTRTEQPSRLRLRATAPGSSALITAQQTHDHDRRRKSQGCGCRLTDRWSYFTRAKDRLESLRGGGPSRGARFAECLSSVSGSLALPERIHGLVRLVWPWCSGHLPMIEHAAASTIGPALAPMPTTDAVNARFTGLSRQVSPVCLSADGPFVPSSVCVSGRTASALGPPACRAGLAKSPAGPGRVKRVGDRSLQDPARTISAQYPPAELNFIAKIFQKNPPRCRSCWKLIAADIWGCCSIFECWKMTNRCDEFATMNQCLQPLG